MLYQRFIIYGLWVSQERPTVLCDSVFVMIHSGIAENFAELRQRAITTTNKQTSTKYHSSNKAFFSGRGLRRPSENPWWRSENVRPAYRKTWFLLYQVSKCVQYSEVFQLEMSQQRWRGNHYQLGVSIPRPTQRRQKSHHRVPKSRELSENTKVSQVLLGVNGLILNEQFLVIQTAISVFVVQNKTAFMLLLLWSLVDWLQLCQNGRVDLLGWLGYRSVTS